jgi:hypothetical protein
MDLIFDDEGQWSFDYSSYLMWATLDRDERIRSQLTSAMLSDCCGVTDRMKAREFAACYRITFIRALKRMAEAGGFSPGDDRWPGRQLILTSRNFLPAMGTKNPFIDGPDPDTGPGLAGDRWKDN